MNNIQKRFLLFLLGCIPLRAFFVYIAKVANKDILHLLGFLALLPAIGFFYIYFTGSRNTGGEVFGDKIWWNNLRPIHGLLYTLFALNAIYGNKMSYIYLLVDVVFGLSSFLLFHYTNGNFERL
uniref:Uncharacterized protein n=1 Tax=viral metagenome TaxID=1070528 RepID=A0A6C0ISX3_9ZZZZ